MFDHSWGFASWPSVTWTAPRGQLKRRVRPSARAADGWPGRRGDGWWRHFVLQLFSCGRHLFWSPAQSSWQLLPHIPDSLAGCAQDLNPLPCASGLFGLSYRWEAQDPDPVWLQVPHLPWSIVQISEWLPATISHPVGGILDALEFLLCYLWAYKPNISSFPHPALYKLLVGLAEAAVWWCQGLKVLVFWHQMFLKFCIGTESSSQKWTVVYMPSEQSNPTQSSSSKELGCLLNCYSVESAFYFDEYLIGL